MSELYKRLSISTYECGSTGGLSTDWYEYVRDEQAERDAALGEAVRHVAAIWGDDAHALYEGAGCLNVVGFSGPALYLQAIAAALEKEQQK